MDSSFKMSEPTQNMHACCGIIIQTINEVLCVDLFVLFQPSRLQTTQLLGLYLAEVLKLVYEKGTHYTP